MNTKRLIPVMLLSLAIIMGWNYFVARWYQQHPEALHRPTTEPATTQEVVTTRTAAPLATTSAATQPGPSMTAATATLAPAPPTTAPSQIVLGSDPNYVVQLRLTPRAAAIESATLKPFKGPGGQGEYV